MAATFMVPGKIITGTNALAKAVPLFKGLGKHALIVSDAMMVQLGNVALLEALLTEQGITDTVYDSINGEPTDHMITLGVQCFQQHHCDFLIALGGGSPIDSMKAIAMMVACQGDINEQQGVIMDFDRPAMVAIPTTAGTGSEATQFTIITNTKKDIKMLLKGPKVLPDIAVIDPQFTMSAPRQVSAATGVDALCHALEAYTSRVSQPLSDTFALSALKRIFTYLPICYEQGNHIEARTQMSIAALEAGIAFNNASVTLVHGLSRPIGALFHIAHGLSNAMLLEGCMHYILAGTQDKFAEIARACHMSDEQDDAIAADILLKQIHTILKTLQIPTLKEAGVDEHMYFKMIPKMAQDAMDSGSPANTIMSITLEDIHILYQSLYH